MVSLWNGVMVAWSAAYGLRYARYPIGLSELTLNSKWHFLLQCQTFILRKRKTTLDIQGTTSPPFNRRPCSSPLVSPLQSVFILHYTCKISTPIPPRPSSRCALSPSPLVVLLLVRVIRDTQHKVHHDGQKQNNGQESRAESVIKPGLTPHSY